MKNIRFEIKINKLKEKGRKMMYQEKKTNRELQIKQQRLIQEKREIFRETLDDTEIYGIMKYNINITRAVCQNNLEKNEQRTYRGNAIQKQKVSLIKLKTKIVQIKQSKK